MVLTAKTLWLALIAVAADQTAGFQASPKATLPTSSQQRLRSNAASPNMQEMASSRAFSSPMGAAFAVGEQWVHLVIAQADALERFGHSVATCAATAMKAHDIFNIGCMAGMVMLTFATPFFPALNVPLAFTILAYAAIDMLWLCVQPHIFDSPRMVGAHHLAVMVVAFHAATHTPHNKFTSWSACAEVEVEA